MAKLQVKGALQDSPQLNSTDCKGLRIVFKQLHCCLIQPASIRTLTFNAWRTLACRCQLETHSQNEILDGNLGVLPVGELEGARAFVAKSYQTCMALKGNPILSLSLFLSALSLWQDIF